MAGKLRSLFMNTEHCMFPWAANKDIHADTHVSLTVVYVYTYVGLFITTFQIHNKKLLNFIVDVCNNKTKTTKQNKTKQSETKQIKTNFFTYCNLPYIIRVTVIYKGNLKPLRWISVVKANIRTTGITQDPPGHRHDGHRIIRISGGRSCSFCLCSLLYYY